MSESTVAPSEPGETTRPTQTEPTHTGPTHTEPSRTAEVVFDVEAVPGGLRAALEAVLMVIEEPVTSAALAAALERPEEEVEATLTAISADEEQARRGFALRCLGGGWRYYSRHDLAPAVEKFLLDGQRARLSQAALETLAVVAYRQPVSRARISGVRGVNVDGVVRTLLTRGLITEIGVDEEHGAVLYGTTAQFLQRLGLRSLDDLPPLAPYLPDSDVLDTPSQERDA